MFFKKLRSLGWRKVNPKEVRKLYSNIDELLKRYNLKPKKVLKLKGDGSQRFFYRLEFLNESFVLILPQPGEQGILEAENYYKVAKFLEYYDIPAPRIKLWDSENKILIVEDLGNTSLFDLDESTRIKIYPRVIEIMVKLQSLTTEFESSLGHINPIYDFEFMWKNEFLYFFEWYVKKVKCIFPSTNFLSHLKALIKSIGTPTSNTLIHRDFQSKNIMIKNGEPFLIDFQGMRIGDPLYDLASLIFDPYISELDNENLRKSLFSSFCQLKGWDQNEAVKRLYFIGIARLHQAIGAYCKLSSQGKVWFKKFINPALFRLKNLLKKHFSEIYKLYEEEKIL